MSSLLHRRAAVVIVHTDLAVASVIRHYAQVLLLDKTHHIIVLAQLSAERLVRAVLAVNDAEHPASGLLVILWVDALDVFNVADKLFIGILACLNGEVLHVGLDCLQVRLDEAVDLDEREEGVDCHSAGIEQQ